MWLKRLAVDITPLRESRDFRLLTAGSLITGLGTQATLVALPYQAYVPTGSAFLTGCSALVGLAAALRSPPTRAAPRSGCSSCWRG